LMALPAVGVSGVVIGADIASAMLVGARDRLKDPLFYSVAADGQALPFKSGTFDAVICHVQIRSAASNEYWDPIDAGMGSMPQVYVVRPEIDRRAVREE